MKKGVSYEALMRQKILILRESVQKDPSFLLLHLNQVLFQLTRHKEKCTKVFHLMQWEMNSFYFPEYMELLKKLPTDKQETSLDILNQIKKLIIE